MPGTLTIHSNGDGSLLSGHSWIEYRRDGGESHTYGTWGNNPTGEGNGLFKDLEKGRPSDASRSMRISDEQEKVLFAKIKEYEDKGENGWRYLNPCSGFAADAWQTTTGEKLDHRSYGVSNPSKLKQSIEEKNKQAAQPQPQGGRSSSSASSRPQSSRRPVNSSVQACQRR